MVEFQGTDEKMPAPGRPEPPRIDGHSRGRDRGVPIEIGLFHALFRDAHANFGPRIVAAVGDDRPSVVPALPHPVDLVSAPRAMFDGPERARRVERGALGVPVAPGPDFRASPRPPNEGIIRGDAPVAPDANNLAVVEGEVLRLIRVSPFAERQKECPVPAPPRPASRNAGRLGRETPSRK